MLLYGQTFSSLTVEKGLSDNQVHTLEIDGRGLLWIGTDEGLNRYDGYGVTVYRSNPFDDKPLKSRIRGEATEINLSRKSCSVNMVEILTENRGILSLL